MCRCVGVCTSRSELTEFPRGNSAYILLIEMGVHRAICNVCVIDSLAEISINSPPPLSLFLFLSLPPSSFLLLLLPLRHRASFKRIRRRGGGGGGGGGGEKVEIERDRDRNVNAQFHKVWISEAIGGG